MAARVNVKFAIALAAGIIIIGSTGIVVAFFALNNTGDEYADRGDAALATGDIELAAENYEKAVGQDRTRLDWLEKWRSALIQVAPETQADYEKRFTRHYLGILEQMAVLDWDNPERQRTLLDERYKQVQTLFPSSIAAWQNIMNLAKERVDRLDQSDPSARSLWRYHGLATVSQMALTDVDPLIRDEGLENLRKALEADPTDIESARSIVLWHAIMWRKAHLARRTIDARRLRQELQREIDALLEAFPSHPNALLTELEITLDTINVLEANEAEERAKIRALLGEEATIINAYRAADPRLISSLELTRLNSVMNLIGTPDRLETMLELLDRVLEAQSVDPRLVVLKADILGGLQRTDEAIAVIQDYLAEPVRPVSLEGLVQRYFRPQALLRLADQALAKWESADTATEKQAALGIAKEAQRLLNETTQGGSQSPEALTVAGKLAQAEGRTQESVRIFTELVEKIGQNDPDTRWRLASSLRRAEQLGAAKNQLQLILDQDPSNLRALLSLADIHARLKEESRARAVLTTVKDLYPEMPELAQIEAQLDRMLETDTAGDQIRTIIVQARSLRADQSSEGLAEARELLRSAFEETPDNIALAIELVDIETMRGEIAEARRVIARALTYNPNDLTLARVQRSLEFEDPFAAALALIDETEMTEAQKIARKYTLASRYDKPAAAEEYLQVMRTSHLSDPAVLEILFTKALRAKDFDEARRLVAIAAENNADQANGLIYQGRLEIIEGRPEAAARTLQQAVEILPYSSQLLMLLGQTELNLGQVTNGLKTFAKAYEAKPDDANVAIRYTRTLLQLQRREEALDVTRAAVRLNPLNLTLVNEWLNLESAIGDEDVALRERLRLRDQFPSNTQNTRALAELFIKAERWDEAQDLINQLAANDDGMETMLLSARLAALRTGVDEGQRIISEYQEANTETSANAALMIALSDFLYEFGDKEKAIEILRDSLDQQSEELREVDRRLGDHAFSDGNYEQAQVHYQAVLEAGADTDNRVKLRLAETYSKLGQFEEAEALLNELDNSGTDNLTSVLLQAEAAAARGDRSRARALYDRAVELKPNEPAPFLQRARFNAADESQINDALAVVAPAIRLQPDLVMARRMKAEMLVLRGRTSEAISEIRRAIDSSPEDDTLRTLLIQLLVSLNDFENAISFADRTLNDRDGDMYWVRASGDLNARAAELATDPVSQRKHWKAAADRYEQLYKDNPDDSARLRLANARLLQENPNAQQALDLVEGMSEDSLDRGDIMILRARALQGVGNFRDAALMARNSLAKVKRPIELRVWFDQLQQMLGSPLAAGRFAEELEAPKDLENHFELLLVTKLYTDPNRQSELLERLTALEGAFTEPQDLVDLYRYRGRIEFQTDLYADSAESFAKGLEYLPRDLEFNNNLAYLRAKFLDDPQGAIQPAETAASIAPQNANVLDTLGWVYFQANQLTQAQQALQRGRQFATEPNDFIPIEIHLAEVFIAKNDRLQARRLFQSARDRLLDAPALNALYGEDLESLRQQLDQAE